MMGDFYTNVSVSGDNILYRGVENGKRVKRRIQYRPTVYLKSPKSGSIHHSIYKEPLDVFNAGTIKETKEFMNNGIPVYGMTKFNYAFIADEFPDVIDWSIDDILVANLDIETGEAVGGGFSNPENPTGEVTAITMKINGIFHMFGCGDFVSTRPDIKFFKCSNEYDLLKKFIDFWSHNHPDIITGWNVKFFDITYLVNRMVMVLGEKDAAKMSPWSRIYEKTTSIMNKEQKSFDLSGIVILDYMELFRKFAKNGASQESYRLDHIAFNELGERKLSYDEYDSLFTLHKKDFQKFMEYNLRDVELVEKLDNKLKLIQLALTAAYDAKANYDDVFMQTRMWTAIIYNHLRKKNIQILHNVDNVKREAYAGAYVKEPIVGMHDWVASFDLVSLYPSLILQYNISPETFVGMVDPTPIADLINKSVNFDKLKDDDETYCPNGAKFSTEQMGFLPEIIGELFKVRQDAKKKMLKYQSELEVETDPDRKKELTNLISQYDNLQNAKKISLNSAYGALGNAYFFLFDVRLAEAITLSGQLSIQWIQDRINKFLNKKLKTKDYDYVIASDTDSIYLRLAGVVNKVYPDGVPETSKVIKFLDKVCQNEFQPFIDAEYQDMADYLNAFSHSMSMKREALADKAIWTATKHYILNVHNNEGVQLAKPKLKIMGLEAIKSSTPSACREKLKDAMYVIMAGKETQLVKFIDDFRKEFNTLPPEDIASPSSVNGITTYSDPKSVYIKGSPKHVKGCLIYNKKLKELKLNKKYPLIMDGDKIKTVILKEPNPFQSPVFAFPSRLPAELNLEKWIDYPTQFDKTFLTPLKFILDAIGWKTERSTTHSLFGV